MSLVLTFHGLRKNACCYLIKLGLNDSEVGQMLGMLPEMVRYEGKRSRALMVARSTADRVTGAKSCPCLGKPDSKGYKKRGFLRLVTPAGIEPVFQPWSSRGGIKNEYVAAREKYFIRPRRVNSNH